MALRKYVEKGGEVYFPFAKNKLRVMKEFMRRAKLRVLSRWFQGAAGERIWINSLLTNGVSLDDIKIFVAPGLFAYTPYFAVSPTRIRLLTINKDGENLTAPKPIANSPLPMSINTAPGLSGTVTRTHALSRDGRSWIGVDPTELTTIFSNSLPTQINYVRNGTEIGVKAADDWVAIMYGIAPDGNSWWLQSRATDSGAGLEMLMDQARFEVMRAGESGMLTETFTWRDFIEPIVQNVGLSTWTGDFPFPGFAPSGYGVTVYGSYVGNAGTGVGRNFCTLFFSYVTEDVGGELTIESRAVIAAVNARAITRQTGGPHPGEFQILFDHTVLAERSGSSILEGSELYLAAPAINQIYLTPKSNRIFTARRGVYLANGGPIEETERLYVNDTEVHSLVQGVQTSRILVGPIADTDGHGLRFIFFDLVGAGVQTYLYDNGETHSIGAAGVGHITEDGSYLIAFTGAGVQVLDMTGTQLAQRSDVAAPNPVAIPRVGDYDKPALFYGVESGVLRRYRIRTPAENEDTPDEGQYTIVVDRDMPEPPSSTDVDGVTFNLSSAAIMMPFSTVPDFVS